MGRSDTLSTSFTSPRPFRQAVTGKSSSRGPIERAHSYMPINICVAAHMCVMLLKMLLRNLGLQQRPMPLFGDMHKSKVISFMDKPIRDSKFKHIDACLMLIRERAVNGDVNVSYVKIQSNDQADTFMMPLTKSQTLEVKRLRAFCAGRRIHRHVSCD
jgi:hypothetical protein